jgi:hypothetical protein
MKKGIGWYSISKAGGHWEACQGLLIGESEKVKMNV